MRVILRSPYIWGYNLITRVAYIQINVISPKENVYERGNNVISVYVCFLLTLPLETSPNTCVRRSVCIYHTTVTSAERRSVSNHQRKLFVQQLAKAKNKEYIKALYHWPFEWSGDQWFWTVFLHERSVMWKAFPCDCVIMNISNLPRHFIRPRNISVMN